MDHRAALILALGIMCGTAHAGYAQATPPAAWSAGGGAGGSWTTGTAASNSASYSGGDVRTNASFNVGGRAVTVPASARFAANAARVAGAAVFMNPYFRGAAAVATWLGAAGLVYDVASGLWTSPNPDATQSTGKEYKVDVDSGPWQSTYSAACEQYMAVFSAESSYRNVVRVSSAQSQCKFTFESRQTSGNYVTSTVDRSINSRNSSCPVGWYVTPAGCVQNAPPKTVTEQEFVEKITQSPMPDNVPSEVPGRYPIELPRIEPTFIPTGNPQKNPSYNPEAPPSETNQPYVQPGVRVEPAPVANAPWQVSVTPVNRPAPDSTPKPNPVPDTPAKQMGDQNKPDERDFCDKHPKAIACQEMEPPEDPGALPTHEVDMKLTPESGFLGTAACPSPIRFTVSDLLFEFSWQPFCDSLAMIKNLLLAFAWLSAAFILLGAKRE